MCNRWLRKLGEEQEPFTDGSPSREDAAVSSQLTLLNSFLDFAINSGLIP